MLIAKRPPPTYVGRCGPCAAFLDLSYVRRWLLAAALSASRNGSCTAQRKLMLHSDTYFSCPLRWDWHVWQIIVALMPSLRAHADLGPHRTPVPLSKLLAARCTYHPDPHVRGDTPDDRLGALQWLYMQRRTPVETCSKLTQWS